MKVNAFRTNEERGVWALKKGVYGSSENGAPLYFFPCEKKCTHLIIAGIHGEEPETTFLLSRAGRFLKSPLNHSILVLCANPDGMTLGTRGNQNGVDLNRNFPTANWKSDPVYSRLTLESARITALSPGASPSSEKETRALISLIKEYNPSIVISMHAPISCIDAIERTETVVQLETLFHVPWVSSIGYETPGSLGSWCQEQKIECVTIELPRVPLEQLEADYAASFAEWLYNL